MHYRMHTIKGKLIMENTTITVMEALNTVNNYKLVSKKEAESYVEVHGRVTASGKATLEEQIATTEHFREKDLSVINDVPEEVRHVLELSLEGSKQHLEMLYKCRELLKGGN